MAASNERGRVSWLFLLEESERLCLKSRSGANLPHSSRNSSDDPHEDASERSRGRRRPAGVAAEAPCTAYRWFIVGQEVKGSRLTQAVYPGKTIWVPLQNVSQLTEFTDRKDVLKE